MSNTKHTPGPWSFQKHPSNTMGKDYVWANDGFICNVHGNTANESEANAKLIAAAPELLTALEAAQISLKEAGINTANSNVAVLVEAAIKKATE